MPIVRNSVAGWQSKMIPHEYAVLTDDLERRLMLAAIEDQFRPQPLRTLGRGLHKLFASLMLIAKRVIAK